jgi:hypothetical protein
VHSFVRVVQVVAKDLLGYLTNAYCGNSALGVKLCQSSLRGMTALDLPTHAQRRSQIVNRSGDTK